MFQVLKIVYYLRKQSKARQSRAKQSRAKQNKTKQLTLRDEDSCILVIDTK